MRFSSILALVVVTASFALGGCAADAEQAGSSTTDENLTLSADQKANEADETAAYFAKNGEAQKANVEDRIRVYGEKDNVRARLPKAGGAFGNEVSEENGPGIATGADIDAVVDEHTKGVAPKH